MILNIKNMLVFTLTVFSLNTALAADTYNDLSKSEKKEAVKALNVFMMPYSKALAKAHVKVVTLMSKCMKSDSDINEYPAEMLRYDENAYCYGNKKILNQFNKIWKDTDPKLPETEYSLYRGYQTVAELGHEAFGAQLLASRTSSMIERRSYPDDALLNEMLGKSRQDFDGYVNFDLADRYFTRGDGCFLTVLIGSGDNEGSKAQVVETCD